MPLVRGSWAAFDGIADWIGADMAKGLEGVGALGTGSDGMRKCFERGCWMIRASRSLLPHHQGQGRESLVRGRASSTWVRGRDSSRRCSEETVEVVVESGKVGCPGGLGCHGNNQLKMWMGEMLFTLRQYGELDSAEGVLEENNSSGMLWTDTRC